MDNRHLTADFKEFLNLLNGEQVEYLVIGGYAVGYHGNVRTTGDIDIWVSDDPANIERVIAVLRKFGFESPGITLQLFRQHNGFSLGVQPYKIEILQNINGIDWRDAYERRLKVDLDGVPAWMISLPYLRKNKQATGRRKDLDDLQNLPDAPLPE